MLRGIAWRVATAEALGLGLGLDASVHLGGPRAGAAVACARLVCARRLGGICTEGRGGTGVTMWHIATETVSAASLLCCVCPHGLSGTSVFATARSELSDCNATRSCPCSCPTCPRAPEVSGLSLTLSFRQCRTTRHPRGPFGRIRMCALRCDAAAPYRVGAALLAGCRVEGGSVGQHQHVYINVSSLYNQDLETGQTVCLCALTAVCGSSVCVACALWCRIHLTRLGLCCVIVCVIVCGAWLWCMCVCGVCSIMVSPREPKTSSSS